ncbi:MAG: Coenzyme F420 hydrogenase/dehydrogenase, beta subunit C-terminal domain [Ignisphaera sp.]
MCKDYHRVKGFRRCHAYFRLRAKKLGRIAGQEISLVSTSFSSRLTLLVPKPKHGFYAYILIDEPLTVEFIKSYFSRGTRFIDVGVSAGTYSILTAQFGCTICANHDGFGADIVFEDTWSPHMVKTNNKGISLISVLTEKGLNLIKEVARDGYIGIQKIPT